MKPTVDLPPFSFCVKKTPMEFHMETTDDMVSKLAEELSPLESRFRIVSVFSTGSDFQEARLLCLGVMRNGKDWGGLLRQ